MVVRPPGPKARELAKRDSASISPSFTRYYPLVIDSGLDCIVKDVDGNQYIDFNSGLACLNVGHTHPKVVDYCLVNTGSISLELRERYKQDGSYPVVADISRIRSLGCRTIQENIVTVFNNYIRHDPIKLSRIILGLIEEI